MPRPLPRSSCPTRLGRHPPFLLCLVLVLLAAPAVRAGAAQFKDCMSAQNLTDAVILRNNAAFDPTFDRNHITRGATVPRVFYLPSTPRELSKAIVCARSSNLRVCARSGGHSWSSSSLCSGVVLDLVRLKEMRITGNRMVIGAGVTTGEALYTAVTEANRFVPTGTCTSVGYAGYALGGGIGTLSSSVGLGCDSVQRYGMVLANGTRIVASRSNNRDIFDAMCGSGGGHLGIVFKMFLRTYNAERFNNVVYFDYEATDESQIPSLIKDWNEFDHDTVPDTYARAQVIFSNNELGRFRIFGVCWKADLLECERRLTRFGFMESPRLVRNSVEPLGGVLNAAPLTSGGKRFEFFTHYENAIKGNFRKTSSLIWRNRVVEPLSFYNRAVRLMKAGSVDGKTVIAQWSPIGGRIRDVDNTATSFRFRDADSSWDQYWFGREGAEEAKADFVRFTSQSRNRVGLYVNYLDSSADVREYYPRGAYGNLVSLKRRLDPDNVLEHNQELETS